ncbi:MAG: hypothetical protein KDC84_07580 [Crocinitomicaceae bacterium]|nr:hypothetical protein [Crocinitomicaceae bacterium]
MKKHLSILFVLTLVLFPLTSTAQKWVKYECRDAKFAAQFPMTPEEKVEDSEQGKSYTATVTQGNTVYMASALIHTTNLQVAGLDQQTLASTSLDAFEKALGATKVTKKNYYSRNDVGLDAEIIVPGFANPILYRVIVIGQIQYQVVVMQKEGKAKKGTMYKFINAFKVLK